MLGFCERCFRVRWLARVRRFGPGGLPYGICRSCDEEVMR